MFICLFFACLECGRHINCLVPLEMIQCPVLPPASIAKGYGTLIGHVLHLAITYKFLRYSVPSLMTLDIHHLNNVLSG